MVNCTGSEGKKTINAMQKEKGGWGRKDREEGRRDGVKEVGRWKE